MRQIDKGNKTLPKKKTPKKIYACSMFFGVFFLGSVLFPLSICLIFCVNQCFEPTKTGNVGLTTTITKGSVFSQGLRYDQWYNEVMY